MQALHSCILSAHRMLLSRLQQGPLTFFVDMTAIPSFLGRALRADGPLGLSLLIVDSLLTGRLGKSQLRPSSEALLRARAPGAQGLPGLHCGPSLLRIPPMVGGVLIGRAGCAAGLSSSRTLKSIRPNQAGMADGLVEMWNAGRNRNRVEACRPAAKNRDPTEL